MRHIFLIISILLTSCSHFDKNQDIEDEVKFPSSKFAYQKAMSHIKKNEIDDAVKTFEDLDSEFPFSSESINGQIINAYLKYEQMRYGSAIADLERFIQIHPTDKNADYAHYLLAMCYYIQIADPNRDQAKTLESKQLFENLISLYPSSKYSKDAKLKIDLINDHLAGYEMNIARYYLASNNIISALGRFKNVVDNYPTTNHSREALYRLVEIYLTLKMYDEAKFYASILGYNNPNNPWYHKAHKLMKTYK